jgi:proton-translocating NADH-quinone oxidoreductase chain L
MLLVLLFVPLINFLALALFGRFIGQTGTVHLILYTNLFTIASMVYQAVLFFLKPEITIFNFGYWFRLGLLEVEWEFMFDCITYLIILIVFIISVCVQIYSFSYIWHDPHFIRFISYLNLFTFFIFFIISAANLIQFFIGWEGVGICSYLLINFWSTRIQANKAAIKAIILNRIGDIGFLTGIVLTFISFKSIDFITLPTLVYTAVQSKIWPYSYELFALTDDTSIPVIYHYVALSFFIAICAKSAQFGLHIWLPAAIEGPTPVSALIHAATMVTAGIFLFLRLAPIFELSNFVRLCAIVIGMLTILTASFTALVVFDLKKIIAFSTCSQLGYIIVACGLSAYTIALFHLLTHAFFKAVLFLSAGVIIHIRGGEQDIRKLYIGIASKFVFAAFTIANFALTGLPFFAGYYSKELILFNSVYINSNVFIFTIIISAFLTTLYSLRIIFYLFFKSNGSAPILYYINPQNAAIIYSLASLMLFSIITGYWLGLLITTPLAAILIPTLVISPFLLYNTKFKPFYWKDNDLTEFYMNVEHRVCSDIALSNEHFLKDYADVISANIKVQEVIRTVEHIINVNALSLFEKYEGWSQSTFNCSSPWIAPLTYYPQKSPQQNKWVIISDAIDDWKIFTINLKNQPYFTHTPWDILRYFKWKQKIGDDYSTFITIPERTDLSKWPLLPEIGWRRLVEIWTEFDKNETANAPLVDYKGLTKLEYVKQLWGKLGTNDQQAWLSQILVSTFEEHLWKPIISYTGYIGEEWIVPACFSEHLRLYIDVVGDPIGHAIIRWELANLIRLSTYEIAYWQFKDLNPPPTSLVESFAPLEKYLEWYIPQQEFTPYTDYVLNCLNIIGTTLTIEEKIGNVENKYPLEIICQKHLAALENYTDERVNPLLIVPTPESDIQFYANGLENLTLVWKNYLIGINCLLVIGFIYVVYTYKNWNHYLIRSYLIRPFYYKIYFKQLAAEGLLGTVLELWFTRARHTHFLTVLYRIVQRNFFINEFINFSALLYLYAIKKYIYRHLDKGVIEYFGPKGIFFIFKKISQYFSFLLQPELKYHLYIFLSVVGIFLVVSCFFV